METRRLIEFLAKRRQLFPNTERRDNIFSAGSHRLKRFLIVPFLSTFVFTLVSLAQRPAHDVCRKRCQTTVQSWTDAWGYSLRQRPSRCRSSVGKAPDDPEEEARQVLHSVELTLKEAGMTMDDLVYVEINCTDLNYMARSTRRMPQL